MPAAVAIPAIIGAASTGASLVGAKMQSNAAKNAAKTQVDASNRALQQYQQINQPYLNAGQSSMTTLGRLMQPGSPYTPQQQQQDAMGPMSSNRPAGPPPPMNSQPNPMGGGMPMGGQMGPGGPPPQMGGGPMSGPVQGSPMMSAMGPMGQTVKIQAPDGSVRDIPRQQAQMYISRGGRVVG